MSKIGKMPKQLVTIRDFFAKFLQKRSVRIVLVTLLFGISLDWLFPFRPQPPYSTLITAADGTVLHAFLNKQDKWRLYTELHEITPTLRKTILFKEDQWFYWHLGVNPLAIVRATFNNLLRNKRTSGASTITMQVVRLLEPRQRTYTSKLLEMLRAFQLELHYSKDEILQLYINLVPYGSNIEGMKSASMLYFQKMPQVLSLAEVVTLSIIPNRPSSLRLGEKNALVLQERNKWLKRLGQSGLFTTQAIADALQEPLQAARHEAPKLTPHLAIRLQKDHPHQPIIRTTIQLNKQRQVEQLVLNYVNRLRAMNIHNAAVLVLNNQTHAIEAYVGSADFNNPEDGGQVDGVRAIRSPGSTLKPLLYATAFDKGLLTPKSAINDVPTNFGGYEPENFDRLFHGKITVEFALANSLNVPAVKVLKEVSTPVLVEKLKKANFQTVRKTAKNLGLSLALGGCGVTLEELTTLFSAFANQGAFTPAHLLSDQTPSPSAELISEEASYVIQSILTQITRPDLPNNYDYTYRLPKVAWKTGTSFGKKDAWSIGYNTHYTVGVWVGNFSGEGVPELNGANIATPLLFSIFNTIDYNSTAQWFGFPKNLLKRKVCAESGSVPNEFCTHQILDYYIPGVSSTIKCQHLKAVWVNAKATLSYCTQCLPDSGAVRKLYPNFAPELISWFESKHILYEKIPAHNPTCTRIFDQNAPQIVYPVDGNDYYLDKKETQQLALTCQASNDVKEVYWYINDKLLQKASPSETVFFTPSAGQIKISCSDDKGRNADSWITVRL
ncbi:MAG: penicillin-binding protein 1C [Spirosomataceae bacterium]